MQNPLSAQEDEKAIDDVTALFFSAFTNLNGALADIDSLYRIFIPQAIIIKNAGATPEIYDLAGFVEPRKALLGSGSLLDFSEEETSEKTEIFGNIAHRFSHYRKSWTASGQTFAGRGAKTIQFVRTSEGWRISSLGWDDE